MALTSPWGRLHDHTRVYAPPAAVSRRRRCRAGAINELKIEKEIYAIEKCWSTTELDVREYKKDGSIRGHVLGAAEEINLQLEDHLLNLQTMSGSRFVGRYAQKVRTWEKTLNMVVETLDVWYNVQRKWMYLESIFIGADSVC